MLVFFLTINKQKTKPKQLLSFRVIVLLQTSLTFFFFLWEFFVFVFLTRMHPCMFYHCYKGFRCCILITSPPPLVYFMAKQSKCLKYEHGRGKQPLSEQKQMKLCQNLNKIGFLFPIRNSKALICVFYVWYFMYEIWCMLQFLKGKLNFLL